MTDQPTIQRLREHDAAAWAALYDRHVRDVWRFLHRRTGSRTAADDLTGETFLAAVESIAQLDPQRGAPTQWLFGIARRKLADHLRKRVKLRLVGALTDELPAPTPPVVDPAVAQTLAAMPPPQRDVLTWMYRDGLSVRQIADRLNRSDKAVENLLYRARNRFRDTYTENCS